MIHVYRHNSQFLVIICSFWSLELQHRTCLKLFCQVLTSFWSKETSIGSLTPILSHSLQLLKAWKSFQVISNRANMGGLPWITVISECLFRGQGKVNSVLKIPVLHFPRPLNNILFLPIGRKLQGVFMRETKALSLNKCFAENYSGPWTFVNREIFPSVQ